MGQFEFDHRRYPMPGSVEADMYRLAEPDRDRFLVALRDAVLPNGEWASYGAMRLVMSLFGAEIEQADYEQIVIAGLQFLRTNGVPSNRLSPNEWQFWLRTGGREEPWLVSRPAPRGDRLTPLIPGESRQVAQVNPGPSSNLIYVSPLDGGGVVAIVDDEWSDEEPRRTLFDWHTAPTLHELYLRIGEAFQVPCHWADAELEPYFPLPAARI